MLDRDEFMRRVQVTESCWLWTGAKAKGYGRFTVGRRTIQAHRWAYELFVGPIPDGLVIDHLCRVPACCNPAHLEPVTRRVNNVRGVGWAGQHYRKTECAKGHPLAGGNLYVHPTNGRRACRRCVADAQVRRQARLRAASFGD